uniref:Uncharacterized protein n=1 Tax=Romanomermis culicivorax TaxID=13658 RepID=A0A915I5Y8_ROMCU
MFVSAYKFVNDRLEEFKSFVEKLTKIRAVGISFLCDGIMLLLFPVGDLSDYIGFPRYGDSENSLHCLTIGYRSCVSGLNFIKDPYDFNKSNQIMPKGCRINLNKLKDSPPDLQPKVVEKSSNNSNNSNSARQALSDALTEPLPSAVNATELIESTVAAAASVIKKSGVADVDLCVPHATKNPPEMRDQDLRLQHLPSLLPLNVPSVLDPRLIKMLQMTDLVGKNSNGQQPVEKPSSVERDLSSDMEKRAKGDVDLRVYQQPPPLHNASQKDKVTSRKVAPVSDSRHDFIAVHDTPLSPGPVILHRAAPVALPTLESGARRRRAVPPLK